MRHDLCSNLFSLRMSCYYKFLDISKVKDDTQNLCNLLILMQFTVIDFVNKCCYLAKSSCKL